MFLIPNVLVLHLNVHLIPCVVLASFPGSPGTFLRKHDVIEIGLKQKGNVLRIVQPTMRLTFGVYDIHSPVARSV